MPLQPALPDAALSDALHLAPLDCTFAELTVEHAQALRGFLVEALERGQPVNIAQAREIDLAGLQLLLAFDGQSRARGQVAFDKPLPPTVSSAFSLAGCDHLL